MQLPISGSILHCFRDIAGFFAKNSHATHIPPKIWGYSPWTRLQMLGFREAKNLS